MADFTREEVMDIAHKLLGADLSGLDLSRADLSCVGLVRLFKCTDCLNLIKAREVMGVRCILGPE